MDVKNCTDIYVKQEESEKKDKMKKLSIILLMVLMLTGCASKLMKLKEGITEETTVELSDLPAWEELVDIEEGTVLNVELLGDKYIIKAVKDDRTEIMEFPVEFETVIIDGTLEADMSVFYSDPAKLSKVSYAYNEDETIMTITDENGEESYSFDVPVKVQYPSYSIADDIVIDTYTGYEIDDFVRADEGVEILHELDEENSILNIKLSKNDWSVNESVLVTLISSEPQYPIVYEFVKQVDTAGYTYTSNAGKLTLTFLTETTGTETYMEGMPITWYVEGEYMYVTQTGSHWTRKIWYEGDYLHYSYLGPQSMYGVYTYKLVK